MTIELMTLAISYQYGLYVSIGAYHSANEPSVISCAIVLANKSELARGAPSLGVGQVSGVALKKKLIIIIIINNLVFVSCTCAAVLVVKTGDTYIPEDALCLWVGAFLDIVVQFYVNVEPVVCELVKR